MSARGRTAWRIATHTAEFNASDLSGGGAGSTGGRWNSKGRNVVYASMSIALATLETLAHLTERVAIRNAFLVRLALPGSVWSMREIVQVPQLPPTWLAEPPGSTTMKLGDDWLTSGRSPLLLVPSVIIPEEFNVLINPAHPQAFEITAIVIRQFIYDPRF